ncbi:MAG: phosphoglucomutase/phosphomannomutase family protein [Blautia sp.]|nr:phosphoglucomutase/phosphomannomutase family protein [Blautia sp.]
MIRFGTGGWRAIIGDEFTRSNIQLLAKALSEKMKFENVHKEGVVIGYDRRFLSKESVKWACEAFAAEGIHSLFVNRSSPTPLIMFYVEKHKMHYGLMVTASHNPATYNGIKIFTYGGRDANEEQTKDIENYALAIENRGEPVRIMPYEQARETGLVTEFNPINEYLDSIIDHINMKAIRSRGLRLVLDPMYGVSQASMKTILSTARCELDVIHGSHDTLFGRRMPAPSKEVLTELRTYVLEMECDLGIATDGDADRIGVIDDLGRYLHANDILVLLYYYLLKYKGWKGPAVRSISTTHMLDRIAKDFGEECYEVSVGFKHVSSKMAETNAVIGGESSGGMAIRGHINGKDGIYASVLLVEMVAVTGLKLSEFYSTICREYGKMYMVEKSLQYAQDRREDLMKMIYDDRILPEFPYKIVDVSYLDGCRICFSGDGWIAARFSGTEPLVRLYCEMSREEDANECIQIFQRFLNL